MRKFIRHFGSGRGFAVCVLFLVAGVVGLCMFQAYASLTPEEEAKQRYDELMAQEVSSVEDAIYLWSAEAWRHIEAAIPGAENWIQSKGPLPVDVDVDAFPKTFLDNIIWYLEGESEVPVAEILIFQSRLDRTICILNSDNKPICLIECPFDEDQCAADTRALERYPDLYMRADAKSIIAHLDVARVLLRVELIPSDRLYDYLLDQIEAGDDDEDEDDGKDSGGDGAKSGDETNHLWLTLDGPPQNLTNTVRVNINIPSGFTNRLSVYSLDIEGTNHFRGIANVWQIADTNLSSAGTNEVRWLEADQMGRTPFMDITNRRYYRIINEGIDSDGDSLNDGYERHISKTAPNDPDTDDDSLSDGWEVLHGLDPLDDGSGDPDNGAAGNPDDDDWSNFQEYNLGLNPVISNTVDNSNTAGLTVYVPSSL